ILPITPLFSIYKPQVTEFFRKMIIVEYFFFENSHLFLIVRFKCSILLTAIAKISHIRPFIFFAFNPVFKSPFIPNIIIVLEQIANIRITFINQRSSLAISRNGTFLVVSKGKPLLKSNLI